MRIIILLALMMSICIKAQVKDIEGQNYKTVIIGSQTWVSENLNVSTFRNGDKIKEAKTIEEWEKAIIEKKPAWCYYDNDIEKGELYGKLYNWYALNDSRGLAPLGWHIPTIYEWTTLNNFLLSSGVYGTYTAPEQMSEKGDHYYAVKSDILRAQEKVITKATYVDVGGYYETKWVKCSNCDYWKDQQRKNNPCTICRNKKGKYVKTGKFIPKTKEKREEKINVGWDGTNESGFSALPGGKRMGQWSQDFYEGYNDGFKGQGVGYFWSSTAVRDNYYWYVKIESNSWPYMTKELHYINGLSIRCIKD
jgi:uncharacterized protein (TIGR02145 family)